MKLTESQLKQLIQESVVRVLNEIGYHEKQKKEVSDDEREDWLLKKSASKKYYYDSQKKYRKDSSDSVDYYQYKRGANNFRPIKENVDAYSPKMLWVDSRVPGVGSSWYYGGKDQMTMDELEDFIKKHDAAISYNGDFFDSVYDIAFEPDRHSIDTYGMPTGRYIEMEPTVTIVPRGTVWDDNVYGSKRYKWPEGYKRPESSKPERDWRNNK